MYILQAGNAVIFLTSINNSLDLRNTFYWGRTTLDSCSGSDERLPTTAGCQEVEGVFLERMGLTWKDAVALLGAHTLGRGQKQVRNHPRLAGVVRSFLIYFRTFHSSSSQAIMEHGCPMMWTLKSSTRNTTRR